MNPIMKFTTLLLTLTSATLTFAKSELQVSDETPYFKRTQQRYKDFFALPSNESDLRQYMAQHVAYFGFSDFERAHEDSRSTNQTIPNLSKTDILSIDAISKDDPIGWLIDQLEGKDFYWGIKAFKDRSHVSNRIKVILVFAFPLPGHDEFMSGRPLPAKRIYQKLRYINTHEVQFDVPLILESSVAKLKDLLDCPKGNYGYRYGVYRQSASFGMCEGSSDVTVSFETLLNSLNQYHRSKDYNQINAADYLSYAFPGVQLSYHGSFFYDLKDDSRFENADVPGKERYINRFHRELVLMGINENQLFELGCMRLQGLLFRNSWGNWLFYNNPNCYGKYQFSERIYFRHRDASFTYGSTVIDAYDWENDRFDENVEFSEGYLINSLKRARID